MNLVAANHKTSSFGMIHLFEKLLPKEPNGQAFFWGIFPALFLILNLAVAALDDNLLNGFFPWITLFSAIVTFRFSTMGLSLSYLVLGGILLWMIPQIEHTHSSLWIMGIFFSLSLSLYILLLGREEAELCLRDFQTRAEKEVLRIQEIEADLIQIKQSAQSKENDLEEEIKKWKEEAEQRRIEKNSILSHLESIQSEMALLNLQKEKAIQEADQIQTLQKAAELKLEEAYESSRLQLDRFKEKEAELGALNQTLVENLIKFQDEMLILQQKSPSIVEKILEIESPRDSEKVLELERSLKISEAKYAQLHSQFEEKNGVLFKARQELYQLQGKLEILEKEKEFSALHPDRNEATLLEEQVNILTQEMSRLEEEIVLLENVLSSLLSGI